MKHINLTNWRGSITDWTKLNYIYGGLDDSYAVKGNLRIDKDNYNYVEYRESNNLIYNLGATGSTNGLNFTIDKGNINVDGTPTSSYAGRNYNNYFADNSLKGTYTLKNCTSDFPVNMFVRLTFVKNGSRNYAFNINANVQTRQFTFDGTETNFRFEYAFQSETLTAQSGNIKPMIIKGSTALTYEPYFEGKKYVVTENLGIVDLGSLTYTLVPGNRFYTTFNYVKPILTNQKYIAYCSMYNITSRDDVTTGDMNLSISKGTAEGDNNSYINIVNSNYSDATAFKEAMSGVMLIYELKDTVIEVVE